MPHAADASIVSTPRLAGYCEANSVLLTPKNRAAFHRPGLLLPNGGLQQIAAKGFPTPQDVIAILLQGLVRRALLIWTLWLGVGLNAKCLD